MSFLEFRQKVKAKEILLKTGVLLPFFDYVITNNDREVVAILGGRVEGDSLLIFEMYLCKRSTGTRVNVEINPEDMIDAQSSFSRGNYTVGWAHGHLGYGVFMSGTDIATQTDYQAIFPDSVALVVDPFHDGNLEFGFFRIKNKKAYKMDYRFLV